MRAFLTALSAWAIAFGATAQGAIQQSGAITPFHIATWYSNGIIGDGGQPGAPFVSGLAMYNGGSCPFSVSSQPQPGVYLSPYSQMSFCITNSVATFTFSGLNGQANPSVVFNIGGVNYPFPGGYGNVMGPSSSTNGDLACFNGTSGAILEDCGSPGSIVGQALPLSTVSGLPTCNSSAEGISRGATDLLNPSFMSPAVGGGTFHGRVYCAGSAGWITE